ncbi:MAG TPA: type II toxin-antitoxin system HicB family antitoxin [Phototrophicaceae bacterium]|nr:type II toxin-antitoxin system HicB family antitoxin [Phototrophicaceae bacterium]
MRQVILIPDFEVGGYIVEVPSLPGCVSAGDTLKEALENVRYAIQDYIAYLEDEGRPVPHEDSVRVMLAEVDV